MFEVIRSEDVIDVIRNFLQENKGDAKAEEVALQIGGELLGVSMDTMLDFM